MAEEKMAEKNVEEQTESQVADEEGEEELVSLEADKTVVKGKRKVESGLLLLLVLLVILGIYSWYRWRAPTVAVLEETPPASLSATVTLGDKSAWRNLASQATTFSFKYRGQVAGLTDRLTVAYLGSLIQNATAAPRTASQSGVFNRDLVFTDPQGTRLVLVMDLINQKGELQGEVEEAFLVYPDEQAETLTLAQDPREFLITLVGQTFGTLLVPSVVESRIASSAASARNAASKDNTPDTLSNYLDVLRLRRVGESELWRSSLLFNQESVQKSSAPSNRYLVLGLQPILSEVSDPVPVRLIYAPYTFAAEKAVTLPLVFLADEYERGKILGDDESVVVAGVRGRIFWDRQELDGQARLTKVVVFPFGNYYLALLLDLGAAESDWEEVVADYRLGNFTDEEGALVEDFDALVESLQFRDRQY